MINRRIFNHEHAAFRDSVSTWAAANARVSRIYAGTSEVMKEIIGRGLGLDDRKRG